MNNYQISSKSEAASSQQARNPAPATGNIDTQHTAVAKKLVPFPPVHSESDQATLRLGNLDSDNLNPMTSGEKADAKKLAHAPPIHLESDQATLRLGNPDNDNLNPITSVEKTYAKKLAHAPPVDLESDQANPGVFRIGGQDNDDAAPPVNL